MNVLFIGLTRIDDISHRGMYTDLIREIIKRGNTVTVLTAHEKRDHSKTLEYHNDNDVTYLFAKTGNITKNKKFIEKGIAVVKAGFQYRHELIKSKNQKFDLVICTTPCITFETAVRYIKKRDNAKVVLLLKDMWPYDLLFDNILTKTGWKGFVYRHFERMAEKLFEDSEVIGCMTPKNKSFLEAVYNHSEPLDKAIIIPNSIEPFWLEISEEHRLALREQYGVPKEKTVFVYGGNLGVAQGPDFVIAAIKAAALNNNEAYFLIVGNGTDANRIKDSLSNLENVKCISALPHDTYEELVYACDVGLVFLNWNCHTPNSPSRILQYMEAGLPVICATDDTTDIGTITAEGEFGIACRSNNIKEFENAVKVMLDKNKREIMGASSREYLERVFSVKVTCEKIFQDGLT